MQRRQAPPADALSIQRHTRGRSGADRIAPFTLKRIGRSDGIGDGGRALSAGGRAALEGNEERGERRGISEKAGCVRERLKKEIRGKGAREGPGAIGRGWGGCFRRAGVRSATGINGAGVAGGRIRRGGGEAISNRAI